MAARLGGRQNAVNQKILVKIRKFSAAFLRPEDAAGACEDSGFSQESFALQLFA